MEDRMKRLKEQRDKLLAMKKEKRETQLDQFNKNKVRERINFRETIIWCQS
jgi:hypothetical protein